MERNIEIQKMFYEIENIPFKYNKSNTSNKKKFKHQMINRNNIKQASFGKVSIPVVV